MDETGKPPRWIAFVPNALTCARLCLAAILPFVPPTWWFPIVVAAGASDYVDGWLARRFGVTSRSGALLDGVADKVFLLVALLTFAGAERIEPWQVLVVLARDVAVGVVTVVVLFHREWAAFGRMESRVAGKLTTALLFAWLVAVLLHLPEGLRTALFVLAAVCSVVAATDYLLKFVHVVRERREARTEP